MAVGHVVGSTRLRFSGVDYDCKEPVELLVPLMSVCHSFRAEACLRYYEKYDLDLFGHPDYYQRPWEDHPCLFQRRSYLKHHLAKSLTIELDERSVYRGVALECLLFTPGPSWSFPLVREIRVCFLSEPQDDRRFPYHDWNAEANISAFVQKIKEMAPRITDIGVYFGSCGQASSDMADNEFGYDFDVVDSDDSYESLGREPGCLVSQLLSLASSVKYTPTIYSIPVVLQPSLMNNLTNIDFSIDQYETQFYRLAQRNSRTLERLSVNVWCSTAISGLIVDADGGFVEYPCLRALQLYLWNSDESAELSAFRRAVPFPSLRFLCLSKCMRFSDDVLFRGNAATLEDLRIDLSPELVEMLKRFNVFTPYSHPKLRHVDIHHPEDFESTWFPTVVDYMQFVLGIAPGASHRAIGYFSPGPELQPALSLLCNHACIRILDIRHTCPTFGNVIDLIIALPLLSDLFTSEPVRGPLLPGATISDLPGSTLSTYNPISKRFRCWRIEHSGRIRIQDSAVCVLLLALLCPNFGHLSVSLASRDGYLSAMKEIIAMDGYRQHEQRLRRLLPDNCK